MNDIFIEQLVARKRRTKDTVLFIASILVVILIPITFAVLVMNRLIIAYFLYVAFFLFVFGIWGIWYVRSHQNVEYEYQMVQDTIVVSKIIAKRKRKEILKADVKQFDILTKSSDKELDKLGWLSHFEIGTLYHEIFELFENKIIKNEISLESEDVVIQEIKRRVNTS